LIEAMVFLFLSSDVVANDTLVATHCRYEVPSSPETLAADVPLVPKAPRDLDRALALYEPNDLRDRKLGRDRDQHVHVVRHQMPFFYRALSLPSQIPKHFAKVLPNPPVNHFPSALGYENYVVFAAPDRVA